MNNADSANDRLRQQYNLQPSERIPHVLKNRIGSQSITLKIIEKPIKYIYIHDI